MRAQTVPGSNRLPLTSPILPGAGPIIITSTATASSTISPQPVPQLHACATGPHHKSYRGRDNGRTLWPHPRLAPDRIVCVVMSARSAPIYA